jgi:leucyl aminopeptidase
MPATLSILALLAAALPALAAPASTHGVTRSDDLWLVKTSEADPGQWVTEQQKLDRFVSKNIGFIDITDVEDKEVLSILSGHVPTYNARAITYPAVPLHKDEGNKLLEKVTTDGPKSWLKTYSE